jgi:hypothetical protein
MPIESWVEIPSQPGLLASSMGRIMVDPYLAPAARGGERVYGGQPTSGQWDGKRYLYARKGHKTAKVHRLVCEAFNGPPQEGQVCMHIDENAANNRPENLAWGSQKENLNAPGFIAHCKSRTGANSPTAKGRAAHLIN